MEIKDFIISTMEKIIDDVQFEENTSIRNDINNTIENLSVYGGTEYGFKIYALNTIGELNVSLETRYKNKFNIECEKAFRVIARTITLINSYS